MTGQNKHLLRSLMAGSSSNSVELQITSDAGVPPFRELDEAFRLTENRSTVLCDPGPGKNTQHTMLAMLRQSVYGRLPG
ncbi:MAG: hypothetical protein ACYSUI_08525 [Planctomycetota bacterium]